jgi:hypothetical protein
MAERIRLSRAAGWRMPENAVNIARPGKWGNPFVVGRDGTRLQCAAKLLILSRGFIALHGPVSVEAQLAMWRRLRRNIGELKGKDLACWCALDGGACHGDLLLHLANGTAMPKCWTAGKIELPGIRLGMSAQALIKLQKSAPAAAQVPA